MKVANGFTLFYDGVFSNFYPAPFVVRKRQFATSEQYFMLTKAKHFGDDDAVKEIMATPYPHRAKAAGRLVIGFDPEEWDKVKYQAMMEACAGKFTQNLRLKDALLITAGTELVEASPSDRIWGIGLGENDPRSLNKSKWRGENLLGKVLTELRDSIIARGL